MYMICAEVLFGAGADFYLDLQVEENIIWNVYTALPAESISGLYNMEEVGQDN